MLAICCIIYCMSRQRPKRLRRFKSRFTRFLLLLIIGGVIFNYLRPLPRAVASIASLNNDVQNVQLDWPAQGSAALGAEGFGVLATHGDQSQRPMASLSKLVTALTILEKYPLVDTEKGPDIPISSRDVDIFNRYYSQGGSYTTVEIGEKITQYQALQAVLLPSSNNMADSLALWAFGSLEEYWSAANAFLQKSGLHETVVSEDASGFASGSKSTPSDLVLLGQLALKNKVINEIIRQPSAVIPVHGVIYSANSRLGVSDIIGIKTGLTDEAGGCYIFASSYQAAPGKQVTIVGAITNQPNLRDAITRSAPLAHSAKKYFSVKTAVKAGDVFASISTPWLSQAEVVAKEDISLVAWNGSTLVPRVELARINRSLPAGVQVGTAFVLSGTSKASTPLILQQPIDGPTWKWRLKRF